jgi:hypothetical protein
MAGRPLRVLRRNIRRRRKKSFIRRCQSVVSLPIVAVRFWDAVPTRLSFQGSTSMQAKAKSLAVALATLFVAACSSSSNSPRAVPAEPARNNDGSVVTAIITARFDPSTGVVPFPNNLLLSGTTDLTLNPPLSVPGNPADPRNAPVLALSALDGFSTVGPMSFTLSAAPRASSLTAGGPNGAIRVFEVLLTGPGGGVTSVVRELASPAEFVVAPSASNPLAVGIVPTAPLKPLTSYMVIVTNGITDAAGNDATPDQAYFLAKRTAPLCVNGQSTDPLLPTANACALEPLRLLTNSHLAAASTRGISPDRVVLSWVATTQSTSQVLQANASRVTPAPVQIAPTGLNLGSLGAGLPPVADIFIGTITLPYFNDAPARNAAPAAQAAAVLSSFWRAAPGAYVPPFNGLGLDPTSTNVTFANPFAVNQGNQTIPLVLTVPNAASGRTRPAAGWPIVIFGHGLTRNRTDAFAVAATFAAQGFAVIAIDHPLHGIAPGQPFYVGATPFGAVARERTFEVDLIRNNGQPCPAGQAICPDGIPDASGAHVINLNSLRTSRDNLRQAHMDLIALARTIPRIDFNGDGVTDFDGSRIAYTGQSLGGIIGIPFLAIESSVNTGFLSVPGGGLAQMLNGSPTFGPQIRAGLAAAGIQAGTPDFDQFLLITQTVLDSADPVNYGFATQTDRILMHLAIGGGSVLPDQVVPITVPGAPLSGGEPLARALGLASITGSTTNANGIRGVTRFIQGDHGSLLSPTASAATTAEMQGQMASFVASNGTAVQVQNTSVIRTTP